MIIINSYIQEICVCLCVECVCTQVLLHVICYTCLSAWIICMHAITHVWHSYAKVHVFIQYTYSMQCACTCVYVHVCVYMCWSVCVCLCVCVCVCMCMYVYMCYLLLVWRYTCSTHLWYTCKKKVVQYSIMLHSTWVLNVSTYHNIITLNWKGSGSDDPLLHFGTYIIKLNQCYIITVWSPYPHSALVYVEYQFYYTSIRHGLCTSPPL